MNTYELITPSDRITFKSDDNKVAFLCALILGDGKAGCRNADTDESLPTMLFLSKNPDEEMNNYLEVNPKDFINENKSKIASCFDSFQYTSVSERVQYEEACNKITDPEELQKFKEKWEDDNRTSMSQWVRSAWRLAKRFSVEADV